VIEDWTIDLVIAERVARYLPASDPRFDRRLGAVRAVVSALNSPDQPLDERVMAELAASHENRDSSPDPIPSWGSAEGRSVFHTIIDAAINADLSVDLPRGPAPRPMTDLAVELSMLAGSGQGIIAELRIDDEWIEVCRGPAPLARDDFRLDRRRVDYFGYLT
jgi:hypothetical protein